MDIWIASTFWLLWILVLRTLVYKYPCIKKIKTKVNPQKHKEENKLLIFPIT